MADDPIVTSAGWSCTVTAGETAVPLAGILGPATGARRGDDLVGATGARLLIAGVDDEEIVLFRPAPASEAGTYQFVWSRGVHRSLEALSTVKSNDVYARMSLWSDLGLPVPVIARQDEPPSSPAQGERWLVGPAGSGDWAGKSNLRAEWSDTIPGWLYTTPRAGDMVTINGSSDLLVFTGSAWEAVEVVDGSIGSAKLGGDITTAGKAILTAADAAAQRTALSAAGLAANTFTSAQTATAFIPTGDAVPANGMYQPAANTLGWATNTALRMQLNSTGLGIGTSPGHALDVAGSARFGAGTGSAVVRINGGTGTNQGAALFLQGAGTTEGGFGHYSALFGGAYNANMLFFASGANELWFSGWACRPLTDNTLAFGTASFRWSEVNAFNAILAGYLKLGSYTVATVPSAATAGASAHIYVSNESGGAVTAFSDGTNWRRVTDRAVIS